MGFIGEDALPDPVVQLRPHDYFWPMSFEQNHVTSKA